MYSTKKEDFKKYALKEVMDKIVDIDTVYDLICHTAKNYDTKLAIQKKDKKIATYNEFIYDVSKVHTFLKDNNVKVGTNIGVYSNNNYDFAVISLGIMSYGAVAALIPVQLKDDILDKVSYKYDLEFIICEDELKNNILNTKKYSVNDIYKLEGNLINNKIKPNMDACIVMTGGTTGKSKGALLTNKNVLSGTINGCYGINDVFNERYYSIMPLTHVFGFIRNLLTSIYTGSTIYFNYNKAEMFKDMQEIKPTVVVVVPALAEMFLKLVNQYGIKMLGGELKLIIAGGASVPQYLVSEYKKLNITLCPGYGLTELANMVSGNPDPINKPNSVGLLFPNIEAKIENDELLLKGDNLMKEYYKEEEENKNSFVDGWFKTGDLAKFDSDNFLYITGRVKDIIILSNGENISPENLENEFNKLDFIQDSLVYEENDKLTLEVVLRQNELKKYEIDDTLKFVKEKLNEINDTFPIYSRVNKIIIRDTDFNRSPSMKIIRPGR